jgi:hypothetical protein
LSALVIQSVSSTLIVHPLRDSSTRVTTACPSSRTVEYDKGGSFDLPRCLQPDLSSSSSDASESTPTSPNRQPYMHSEHSGLAVTDLAIEIFSIDTTINDTLTHLHQRLKHGDRTTQRTIDTYLFLCACEHSLHGRDLYNMRVAETDVPHYDTLPDLTRFIQQSFTTIRAPGIISFYIQLLSPLKRKSRTRRGNPVSPTCPVEACICFNIIQATMLGLYPRSSKQPLWRVRVAIVACIRKLQTSSFDIQCKFLAASHDLLRMCFTEYVLNTRKDFCPVEHEFLTKQAGFLSNYDTACSTLCDHVRQTCLQTHSWSWGNVNSVSASSLDRISRMCRTHLIAPVVPAATSSMTPAQLQMAMQQHVVFPDTHTNNCVTPTNCIHQALHTNMLPWNMLRAQSARIVSNFSETLFPILSVCEKHICLKCVLAVNSRVMLKVTKLRMNTATTKLSCANCTSADTVVKINVLGKLLSIRDQTYFCCQECTSLHEYDPTSPLVCTRRPTATMLPLFDPHNVMYQNTPMSEVTRLYGASALKLEKESVNNCQLTPAATTRDRKHRCKYCARICSSRNIQLLHAASASLVSITLCFKHMPPQHSLKNIHDTEALVRFIRQATARKL